MVWTACTGCVDQCSQGNSWAKACQERAVMGKSAVGRWVRGWVERQCGRDRGLLSVGGGHERAAVFTFLLPHPWWFPLILTRETIHTMTKQIINLIRDLSKLLEQSSGGRLIRSRKQKGAGRLSPHSPPLGPEKGRPCSPWAQTSFLKQSCYLLTPHLLTCILQIYTKFKHKTHSTNINKCIHIISGV